MNWGRTPRKRKSVPGKTPCPAVFPSQSTAVLLFGILLCVFFFCMAVTEAPPANEYPPQKAADAREAFGQEHTTLTAVLGIDEYFPEKSVSAGTFPEPPKRWNFKDYMWDALVHFVFGESP